MNTFVIVLMLLSGATRSGGDTYPTLEACTHASLMALSQAKVQNLKMPPDKQDAPVGVFCQKQS